jgi:hypothetical protein
MPRRVSLTVKGGLLIFAVSAISIAFVVLTAFLYLRNAREIRDGDDLVRLGQMTYAYDLQVGGLRGWSVSYKLRYNGKEYSGRAPIPKSNENEMFGYTTAPFPVLYLPENPSVNHPKNWKEPDSHPWHVYGFFLVIPLLLCLSRGPDVLLDFQLARAGIAVVGTAIGGTYTKSGTLKLKYEFRDSDDLLNDGSGYYPVTPKKGAEVVVLYLPQDTAQNRPYPLFYFRAAALEPRVVPLSNK